MSSSASSEKPVDKEFLYGRYQRREDWQDSLYRKAAHKSLDIPDDMNISNVRTGWGWKELLTAGILALGIWAIINKPWQSTESPLPPPPAMSSHRDRDTTRSTRHEKYIPSGLGGQR